jgi:hypothetical protein
MMDRADRPQSQNQAADSKWKSSARGRAAQVEEQRRWKSSAGGRAAHGEERRRWKSGAGGRAALQRRVKPSKVKPGFSPAPDCVERTLLSAAFDLAFVVASEFCTKGFCHSDQREESAVSRKRQLARRTTTPHAPTPPLSS